MKTAIRSVGRQRREQIWWAASYAWVLFVVMLFIWQSVDYKGFPASLAEWEFVYFGESFPTLTLALLIACLAAPALVLHWRVFQRSPDYRGKTGAARDYARAIYFSRMLFILAAVLAIGTVIGLTPLLFSPASSGIPRLVDIGGSEHEQLAEGSVHLVNAPWHGRVAVFSNNLLVTQQNYGFTPVGTHVDHSTLRVFVETEGNNGLDARTTGAVGMLRRDALPGEVLQLYKNSGYAVASPHYVVFVNRLALAIPSILLAVQLLLIVVILTLAGLVVRQSATGKAKSELLANA